MADETLSTAIARLRAAGYTNDLAATDDGRLACGACGTVEDPADIHIEHTVRFEGDTDPGDEAILLAVACRCGVRGLYSAAYGPATPAADSKVLRRLAANGS